MAGPRLTQRKHRVTERDPEGQRGPFLNNATAKTKCCQRNKVFPKTTTERARTNRSSPGTVRLAQGALMGQEEDTVRALDTFRITA